LLGLSLHALMGSAWDRVVGGSVRRGVELAGGGGAGPVARGEAEEGRRRALMQAGAAGKVEDERGRQVGR